MYNMKKLRVFLIAQALLMLLIGLYLVSYSLPDQAAISGNQILNTEAEDPISHAMSLVALFGIFLFIGAIAELVILFFSSFR